MTPDQARRPASAWDWFPRAIWISLGIVIVVNAGMIWAALATFPGSAGPDGFDASNGYNAELRDAAAARALGWRIVVRLEDGNLPSLELAGADGKALTGAAVAGVAERPVGPPERRVIAWREATPGRYLAAAKLRRGRWNLRLTLRADGHEVVTTRAVIAEERRRP